MTVISQLGWFINTIPPFLPKFILATGLQVMFSGVVLQYVDNTNLFETSTRGRLIMTLSMGLGLLFASLSLLQLSFGIYATYLFVLFRIVEGAGAVGFYQKLLKFVETGSIGQFFSISRTKYRVAALFVVIISIMIFFDVVTIQQYTGWDRVRFAYTVLLTGTTALGVRWRLRDVDDQFNSAIIYGLVLCIVGTELYDYVLTGEIVVSLLGIGAFSVGFWVAVVRLTSQKI